MYSLGLSIVELETARRRLLYVFEVADGTATSGRKRTDPIDWDWAAAAWST